MDYILGIIDKVERKDGESLPRYKLAIIGRTEMD